MDRVSAGMDGHISPAYEHIIYYGMDVLLWTFVASVVVLILSFILYQKRPSESAANVFCFRIINPIFHYFIMMLSALIFGTFIYNLLFDSLWNTEYFKIIPIIGCMFVAGLIGYFVAKMITQKSFRVFKRAYIPVLVTAVFAALFCLTFSMDLTGVQGRVPDRAKIEYVDMRLNSDNLIVSESENPELVDEIRDLHQYVVDHADEYKKKSTVGYDEKKSVVDFSVTYTLRSGKTLSRSYELYVLWDSFDDPNSFAYAAKQFANSKAYLRHLYYLDQEVTFSDTDISVGEAEGHKTISYSISPSDSVKLREAISKDIDDGTVINYDFGIRYDFSDEIQYYVYFNDYSVYDWYHLHANVYVTNDMRYSMEFLSHLDDLDHYEPYSIISSIK
jgi:ABC-2 type transport system permease protein